MTGDMETIQGDDLARAVTTEAARRQGELTCMDAIELFGDRLSTVRAAVERHGSAHGVRIAPDRDSFQLMASRMKYIVMALDDARAIADALRGRDVESTPDLARIRGRLAAETGADMQEIVDTLTSLGICAACSIESQESMCNALTARQQGRRLRRLLERARGARPAGEKGAAGR